MTLGLVVLKYLDRGINRLADLSASDELSIESSRSEAAAVTSPAAAAEPSSDRLTDSQRLEAPSAARCQAIYDYRANMNDELTIRAGE